MAGMSVVYIALERIQPEQIFQCDELSGHKQEILQEEPPIPPTGKTHPLIPGGWSCMRA